MPKTSDRFSTYRPHYRQTHNEVVNQSVGNIDYGMNLGLLLAFAADIMGNNGVVIDAVAFFEDIGFLAVDDLDAAFDHGDPLLAASTLN